MRRFILANFLYQTNDYGTLKDFYQKMTAQDQQQMVLNVASGNAQ
jgi:hypothetical protein